MAYVVVVFAMINAAALGAVGWWLWRLGDALPILVETVIQEEVRKQDDRIEKRVQRAQGQSEDTPPTPSDGHLRPGIPYRR